MSRTIVDEDLLSWEVYASGGRYGLPDQAKIVFHCLSDPERRARYVRLPGDNADAEETVGTASEAELQRMLREAEELD